MKLFLSLALLAFTLGIQAQEVMHQGTTYKIKGKTILKEGVDVTNTLSMDEQTQIKEAFAKQKALNKERSEAEKAIKKAEKEQKKAEKKQKQAEKELKARQKAQSKFEKAEKKYNNERSKFDRLKKKGQLPTKDEAKWLKKMEDLKKDLDKAKKRL